MQEELLVKVAVSIRFVVDNADRSEHPAIRPAHRESQVRDHPQLDVGSRLPLTVLQSIRDQQRFTGFDDGLAIGSDIHREGLIDWKWISLRVAGDQGLVVCVVRRFEFGHHRRWNAHDVCQEVDNSLPVPKNVGRNCDFWGIRIHGATSVKRHRRFVNSQRDATCFSGFGHVRTSSCPNCLAQSRSARACDQPMPRAGGVQLAGTVCHPSHQGL
jgi:hypothetical protein